jgi:hypothetical protein
LQSRRNGKSPFGASTGPARFLQTLMGCQVIRPVGGSRGCMTMILFSIVASVVLTVVVNLIFAMAR